MSAVTKLLCRCYDPKTKKKKKKVTSMVSVKAHRYSITQLLKYNIFLIILLNQKHLSFHSSTQEGHSIQSDIYQRKCVIIRAGSCVSASSFSLTETHTCLRDLSVSEASSAVNASPLCRLESAIKSVLQREDKYRHCWVLKYCWNTKIQFWIS